MKLLKSNLSVMALILSFIFTGVEAQHDLKRDNLFDFGWKFHLGGALAAEEPAFDDSQWRIVDLPHDWSIEDLPGTNSPFNINAISQVNGGFTTGGTGWYRKSFNLSEKMRGKRFIILFEGVYMNADVWLNGEFLGNHPYGYTSFMFDISEKINFDKSNVLAVKVKNEGENSRWYSGSGIYRHVRLQVVSSLHIPMWGTYITTPSVSEKEALVNIKTQVINDGNGVSDFKLVTKILGADGSVKSVTESDNTIGSGKTMEIVSEIKLNKPDLWDVESPVLYKTVTEILVSDSVIDVTENQFGIRSVTFDAANGLRLNGKSLKLKGGCIHHDNGVLGSKAYDRAEERRVELLKASGFNAIRSSHNPPSPAFLNACDRYGMLVIDESFDMWQEGKNQNDYHLFFNDWWKRDMESMVLRDRNHPSIIMWSIGNEIPNRHRPEVVELAKKFADYTRWLDPTRAITSAVNDLRPDNDPYFAVLDIAGYNYASGGDHNQNNLYETDHKRLPERIIVGTESYPLEAFGSWMDVIDHPYVIGDFVWTAFDYIGEASIGWRGYFQKQNFFPWNLAYCGDLDICGWKRPQSFYRDVLWNTDKLSIWVTPPVESFEINPERQSWSKWHWLDAVSDWTWPGNEGKRMDVNIYSSCSQVELYLNGKSLGKKTTDRSTKYIANWQVPYEPGTLKAVGFTGKKKVSETELSTAAEVSEIRMTADRVKIHSNGQDLCYITIELTDLNGVCNPKSENQVFVEVTGPGTIAGIGNANPVSLQSFQLHTHNAWRGKCQVIVKAETTPGDITVRVTSSGIRAQSLKIESN